MKILLLGCGKLKADAPCAARELYVGTLFQLRRQVAERSGLPWGILSAKHDLLLPGEQVAPYDERLPAGEAAYGWAVRIWCQLDRLTGGAGAGEPLDIEIHAGADYFNPLSAVRRDADRHHSQARPPRPPLAVTLTCPTRGLGIGRQLQFYQRLLGAQLTLL
jgi:hypothetical protein